MPSVRLASRGGPGRVAHTGKEQGGWHGSTRRDTAAAVLPLALVVTPTVVVDVPACKAVLMLHVFLARLCGVLPGRHPGPGTPGVAEAGSGAVPRRTYQLSVQPGPGAMGESKGRGR
jgi:hypothetical protein